MFTKNSPLPAIQKLAQGHIYHNRSPKPKLLFVWNVEQVLKYINSGKENGNLDNKDITLKAGTLVVPYSI